MENSIKKITALLEKLTLQMNELKKYQPQEIYNALEKLPAEISLIKENFYMLAKFIDNKFPQNNIKSTTASNRNTNINNKPTN